MPTCEAIWIKIKGLTTFYLVTGVWSSLELIPTGPGGARLVPGGPGVVNAVSNHQSLGANRGSTLTELPLEIRSYTWGQLFEIGPNGGAHWVVCLHSNGLERMPIITLIIQSIEK